ncbi:MAG: thioredoxin [Nanoarchaeota archaeon]|nr:thioredoxin [Nanoarchaeota archaeon]
MLELTNANWKKEVTESKIPVIVDFWASWCGPCMMMGPVFEKLAPSYAGKLNFAKASTEENRELAMEHEIRSIPCLIVFKGGKEADRLVGYKTEAVLKKEIDAVLAKI